MNYQRGFCFVFGLGLVCTAFGQQTKAQASIGQARDCFVENKGQWDSRAQFLLQGSSMNMWLTKDGVLLDQYQLTKGKKETIKGDVVKMSFAGANRTFASGLTPLPGKFNYFIGRDKSKWATNVRRFEEVKTTELYKGISARYYMENGMPRYDLIVQPGADPSQVAMKFDGVKSVNLASDGSLKIRTSMGLIEEKGLVAYQEIDGNKETVACRMVSKGDQTCFKTGVYDHSKPLVIDPLFYSTYFYNVMTIGESEGNRIGGSQGQQFLIDSQHNMVITGDIVNLDTFPTTPGAYQTQFGQSAVDAALCKFTPGGNHLIFATLLGGTSPDPKSSGYGTVGIGDTVINADGSYTIPGLTDCSDLPVTANAYLKTYSDRWGEPGFLAQFSANGDQLLNCSFFPEDISQFTKDEAGNLWFAGQNYQNTLPVTDGWPVPYESGGVYVAEMSSDLSQLLYCRFLTGGISIANPGEDTFFGITALAVNGNNLFLTGYDADGVYYRPMKPTSLAAFTTGNACIVALDTQADAIKAVTLLPFSVQSVALSSTGNLVLAGLAPNGLPTTANAYQSNGGVFPSDYIAEISPDLTKLVAATYFGPIERPADAYDDGQSPQSDLKLDANGNVVIAGWTNSDKYLTTPGALLASIPGTVNGISFLAQGGFYPVTSQMFLAKISTDLTALQYSTLIPGPLNLNAGDPADLHLVLDGTSDAYILGEGTNANLPLTPDAFLTSPSQLGSFSSDPSLAITSFLTGITMTAGPTISISNPATFGGSVATGTIKLQTPAPAGGVKVPLSLVPPSTDTTIPSSITIPAGQTQGSFTIQTVPVLVNDEVMIQAGFGASYQYARFLNLAPQVTSTNLSSPILAPGGAVTYTINLSSPAPAGFSLPVEANSTLAVSFNTGATSASTTLTTSVVGTTPETIAVSVNDPTNWNYGFSTNSASETVLGPLFVQELTVTAGAYPRSFSVNKSTAYAGTPLTGTVNLDGAVGSAGETITLSSSDANCAYLPTKLTLNSGQTSFTVPIQTFNVSTNTNITVEATLGGYTAKASFVVMPNTIASLSAASASIGLNAKDNLTVTLNGPAPSGASAAITSSNSNAVTLQSTLPLSATAATTSFVLTSKTVTATTPVTIYATYFGTTKSTTVTIIPPGPTSLKFSAAAVYGGNTETGTITLNQAVTASSDVTLASSSSGGTVPKTVTVSAGSNTASFGVTTIGFWQDVTITVTASLNGISTSSSFVLKPSVLSSISVTSRTVASGSYIMCTVNLTGYASSSTAVIALSSSSSAASVPASVTIPFGASSATFKITAGTVKTNTAVTISATYAGVTKAGLITVTP